MLKAKKNTRKYSEFKA